MRGVIDFLVRQIESDDLVTAGGDADMKLAPGPAGRRSKSNSWSMPEDMLLFGAGADADDGGDVRQLEFARPAMFARVFDHREAIARRPPAQLADEIQGDEVVDEVHDGGARRITDGAERVVTVWQIFAEDRRLRPDRS